MTKTDLILKYFQKKDQLTVKNKHYQQTISPLFRWLIENDHVKEDRTSKFFPNQTCTAKIIAKEEGIAAGNQEVKLLIMTFTSLSFKSLIDDGSKFKNNDAIIEIKGRSHDIFAYERTILNILQRMSGIATETNHLLSLLKSLKLLNPPFIAATRKTPWGLLDKKAVAVSGGLTHRLNLSDGILIKDNHLAVLKNEYRLKTKEETVVKALEIILNKSSRLKAQNSNLHLKTQNLGGGLAKPKVSILETDLMAKTSVSPKIGYLEKDNFSETKGGVLEKFDTEALLGLGKFVSEGLRNTGQLIEIEVATPNQAYQAIETFQQSQQSSHSNHLAILLDNFTPSRVKTLLSNLSDLFDLSQIIFEASGGINEGNIQEFAQTGVDILSLGSLTHSSRAVNLSLEF